jgi:hypothetical protein
MKTLRDSPRRPVAAKDRPCGPSRNTLLQLSIIDFARQLFHWKGVNRKLSVVSTHSPPGSRTSQQMSVNVIHLLPAARSGVDHRAKARVAAREGHAQILRQPSDETHHSTKQRTVIFCAVRQALNMLFGYYENVDGRRRMNVVEGEKFVVFIHFGARQLARSDSAKNTVPSHRKRLNRENSTCTA